MATGGVTADTARLFLDAGASVVAVGSALSAPEELPAVAMLLVEG